jgi:hypothetical protein
MADNFDNENLPPADNIAAGGQAAPISFSGLRPETLQAIAEGVHSRLPDTHGFILIIAPLGGGMKKAEQTTADYVADINREDAIAAMKMVLFRWGINEEWMAKCQ